MGDFSVRDADKSKPFFPPAGGAEDGYNTGSAATATCFCGAVQLEFAFEGVFSPHLCNCVDCHKIHSSAFGLNFCLKDASLKHNRGQDKLSEYAMTKTVGTKGNTMTNYFCKECGSLMYRRGTGFPGTTIMRVGTIDDFNLMESDMMRPEIEQFTKDRITYLQPAGGIPQEAGYHYGPKK